MSQPIAAGPTDASSIAIRPERAVEIGSSASLAIFGDRTRFTPQEVAMLRQIGVEDAEPADLDVFFHVCKRTGLDPFARQIYMIGRETDVRVRVPLDNGNSRVETRRVTKYTIQTGIDGYRLIGMRASRLYGDTTSHDEPLWRGKAGTPLDTWTDYWPANAGVPAACKYTIWVNGQRRTAVCNFDEYAQFSGKGELTSMWRKMPANQLAKCAEAQAWLKAYPADFSGVILEDEARRSVVIDSPPMGRPARPSRGLDGLREAVVSVSESGPAAPADPTPDADTPQSSDTTDDSLEPYEDAGTDADAITKPQLQKLSILRQREGYADTDDDRSDWFQWVSVNIGRLVGSNKMLTRAEASVLIDVLEEAQTHDTGRN